MDTAAAYRDTRTRFTELVLALDDDDLERGVDACPAWRVIDLFAHVAGVAADFLASTFPTAGVDAWSAAQVEARRGRPRAAIAEEWGTVGPALEARMAAMPARQAEILVADVTTHEHDLRGAVDQAGARDSAGVDIGLQFAVAGLHRRIKDAALGALRLAADNQEWFAGEGEAAVSVTAPDSFELFRGIMGRRTDAQLTALEWDGDAAPYLPVFAAFPKPTTNLRQ
jgi:uncharacterized protein (TIGR03083 family)